MKRLLPSLFFLLFMLWPSLFGQQNKDALFDTLTARKQYDQLIPLLQKTLSDEKAAGDWAAFFRHTKKLAVVLNEQRDYAGVQQLVQQSIATLDSAGQGQSLNAATLWSWIAVNHSRKYEFDNALTAYQEAIRLYEKNQFKGPGLAYAYKNLAQIYLRYSNDRQAISYLEAALRSDTTRSQNISVYAQLTSSYLFLDSLEAAERCFQSGLLQPKDNPTYVASFNSSGAALALQKGDFASARQLALQALIYYQTQPADCDQRIRILTTLAQIADGLHKPREAESYFQKAEAEGKKYYTGKSREMAKLYVDAGLFYEKYLQPDRALAFFQKALVQAFPNFNSLNVNDNPALDEAWLESQAMRAAAAKAQVLLRPPLPPRGGEMFYSRHIPERSKQSASPPLGEEMFYSRHIPERSKQSTSPPRGEEMCYSRHIPERSKQSASPPRGEEMFYSRHIPERSKQSVSPPLGGAGGGVASRRLNAAHCFDLSFAVAARLRRTYGNDADKFALAANNRDNYTAAALNLWQLWSETGDTSHLARLFAFLEQTKAQALGDALQQQRALALTGIPDSLLHREESLRLEAAAAAKDLKEKELSGDSVAVVKLKEHAFQQEKEYADFLGALENQHPQFRQYAQAGITANLTAVQSALPDTAALLSWFDAGDRYLCVAVRRGGLSAFEIPRDTVFDRALSRFLGTLADKSRQEADPPVYFSDAHFLFQKLLPEPAISGARSLIIVPDGRLSYLPFEALLTAPHTGTYANAPYLLRSKTVQYAWSATLLTLPPVMAAGKYGLLQIAPFAESARDGLAPLPNSLRDAPKSVGATVLNGAEATAAAFLDRAPRHSVLHLSTHADAGGRDVPGIELYDRRLTLPEIYAQRFHASLVSLSACETGKGEFAEGEGVVSLARAFAYAGAQSLVASHWAVNERSTAELFSAFYTNLEKGFSKAEALRQAKLHYLASPEMDARKAPFHWAAFTLTGADGRVELGHGGWWKWLFAVGGLLLLLAIIRRIAVRR